MEKCLNTFKKPSLDEFCDYIEKHGFDLDPFDLYKEFDKKGWTWKLLIKTRSVICVKSTPV